MVEYSDVHVCGMHVEQKSTDCAHGLHESNLKYPRATDEKNLLSSF